MQRGSAYERVAMANRMQLDQDLVTISSSRSHAREKRCRSSRPNNAAVTSAAASVNAAEHSCALCPGVTVGQVPEVTEAELAVSERVCTMAL